jgi:hypothetical protein
MTTIRQIERLFNDHQHRRLYRELIAARPEAQFPRLEPALCRVIPIAALGVLRLDELSQAHTTLSRRLLNVVLTSQQADGSWSDPMTTALCLRALLTGSGEGPIAARGVANLAALQRTDGLWSPDPHPRLPTDPFATAFILLQLGDRDLFRRAVDFDAALDFFSHRHSTLDPDTKRLWPHAAARCRVRADATRIRTLWSPARPAA